jgi:hypothetical protein
MERPISTRVGIPINEAGLCPQCRMVVNTIHCPWCGSETVLLAPILECEDPTEDEISQASAIMDRFPNNVC